MDQNNSREIFVPNNLEQVFYETLRLETIKAQRKAAEATILAMNTLTAFIRGEPEESADPESSYFDTLMPDCDFSEDDDPIERLEALGWLDEDGEADCFGPYDDREDSKEPPEGEYPPLFLLCDNEQEEHECAKDDKSRNELFDTDEEEFEDDFEDDKDDFENDYEDALPF